MVGFPEQGRERSIFERVSEGDRDAAAEFALKYGPLIQRRVRGKLAPSMRRIFDSQELISTVLRRLDVFVATGKIQVSNADELKGLIMKIAQNAVIDKVRILKQLESVEGENAPIAQALLHESQSEDGPDEMLLDRALERAVAALDDDTDQTILCMWLSGSSSAMMADRLGMNPGSVRMRWNRIRAKLRKLYESESA